MCRDVSSGFKHQAHACIYGLEPFHLCIGEDTGIRVRQDAVFNALLAHCSTVVKDGGIPRFLQVSVKAGLLFRMFAKGKKRLGAPHLCAMPEGLLYLFLCHDASLLHGCAERTVPAPVTADRRQW